MPSQQAHPGAIPAGVDALVAAAGDAPLLQQLARALFVSTLPTETDDLSPQAAARLVRFVAEALEARPPAEPRIEIRAVSEPGEGRCVTLAIVNDDMPFLVDSVANAITRSGIAIRRLLHPMLNVRRDPAGALLELIGRADGAPLPAGSSRESLIYVELERVGARDRTALAQRLRGVLADVRAAVGDWPAMLSGVRAAGVRLRDRPPPVPPHELDEFGAFLEWLTRDNFVFLGARRYALGPDGLHALADGALGLLRNRSVRLWEDSDGGMASDTLRRFLSLGGPVFVTKSNVRSTVHRDDYCDYVGVKEYGADGQVVGEHRFLGLFTSQALSASPRVVPLLRRKTAQVIQSCGFDPASHNGKALIHALGTLPREELFQVDADWLTEVGLGLVSLSDRPRPKLFVRADALGRFLSVLVYVPRDEYTGALRERIAAMLAGALDAHVDRYAAELRSEGLARVHFTLRTDDGRTRSYDTAQLDQRLNDLVRGWSGMLEAELGRRLSPNRAARLTLTHARSFSAAYREQFGAADAADDIVRLSVLGPDQRDVRFYRRPEDSPLTLRLKVYRLRDIIPLSEAVPVLERFGFRVIEEFAFDLDGGRLGWIHDFLLEARPGFTAPGPATLARRLEPALRSVLNGLDENDEFNALVLGADVDARSVGWLRAMFRYLRQTGTSFGQPTVVDVLVRHRAVTAALVRLFSARFDPALDPAARERATAEERQAIAAALDSVQAIDDDRILRLYLAVIEATLRTNAFVATGPEALAFKLESAKVPGLPPPVPYREIFVYSPRIEGVHLRAGPIARGGLRWSDRRDDFRTEVLGLMKAQVVKNTVIVPTGAKGGFYPKQLPPASDRDAWLAEGKEAYRIFIRALLSLTDNIVDGEPVSPEGVVRYDEDDPYLVVAADKGTATFSDIANAIAVERGFWLGDAFASGGATGYDHKAMGITARGAWISVERHFAELGQDVNRDALTVAGVGDMSGDVFGNAMLLSRSIRLVAAFDHRHIFLDPSPEAPTAWAERRRLFHLPRSSWADYDARLLSRGGGVFPRTQKSIPLSPEARAMLGVEASELGPSELIRAILLSPVDLLWFGGIGTYVKAAAESNADVGDRANDPHRVDGESLRARVVGEGANLGVTQAGRIAFARRGGRINTDFIDNSAGVDTSDHEVNIKIAMQSEMAAGRLDQATRDGLLAELTDEVARLVLEDNALQAQALSIAERGGAAALPALARVIQLLEASGRLDRAVEGLPTDEQLAQRRQAGAGLVRPELAILLAYAKMAVYDALVAGNVADDPLTEPDLFGDFPKVLAERYPDAIGSHRLRREIVATELSNDLVNRGGIGLAFELAEELGTSVAHVGTAFVAARAIFGFGELWDAIDAADLPLGARVGLHVHSIEALKLQMSDLLRISEPDSRPGELVALLADGIRRLDAVLDELLHPEPRAQRDRLRDRLLEDGTPPEIAASLVRVRMLDGAVGTVRVARLIGADDREVAEAYTSLGEALGLDWAKGATGQLAAADPWERLLLSDLAREFEQLRLDLIAAETENGGSPRAAVDSWLAAHAIRIGRLRATVARARSGVVSPIILAHIGYQAQRLLSR